MKEQEKLDKLKQEKKEIVADRDIEIINLNNNQNEMGRQKE